ncbi:MAG: quinone-dependent dihydroorotate dehydrogenase [Thermomicrobiales bacterium]|nr:quinone-dependent dihydroorotate dehydrogenase [Thermomicrobiales bacterium]MCO5221911.1 quinone-dependent dihydroorotate dehydrogenase [Thermomicrobiales bacterium]
MRPAAQVSDALYRAVKPLFFRLDPESVHDCTIQALSTISAHGPLMHALSSLAPEPDPRLAVQLFQQKLPFPLGIAAGFDKNALVFPALLALGFGSVETGTVTPLPQPGNPKPRVFRLPEDRGLVNRMGFPNQGVEAVVNNLIRLRQPARLVGCNIGPNKTAVEAGTAPADFAHAWDRVSSYCSYVAVNISSPNTPGLRGHQRADALQAILSAIRTARLGKQHRPLVLKISPDLTPEELDDIVSVALQFRVDAIAATNTTLDRPASLQSRHSSEAGGLSGVPLVARSTATIRRLVQLAGDDIDVIAAGGIFTGRDVLAAISAGAAFTQTYTGFIYRGPAMPALAHDEMLTLMTRHGIPDLTQLRGSNFQL